MRGHFLGKLTEMLVTRATPPSGGASPEPEQEGHGPSWETPPHPPHEGFLTWTALRPVSTELDNAFAHRGRKTLR